MEIVYCGHSCFKVKGKSQTLVFDPFDPSVVGFKLPKLEADIVCVSHDHADHNFVAGVKGLSEGKAPFIVSGPGEYDIQGVHIQAFSTFHDDKDGKERGKNTIYYVEIDGFFLLHLGDLGHALSDEILEELNSVDVLFVPVGGTYTIDYETAMNVVSDVEPSYVIPMHYQTESFDKFISEWGSDAVTKEAKLKLIGRSDMPNETQVVVLEQI